MTSAGLLLDAFGRIRDVVHRVVDGLTADELAHRVDGGAPMSADGVLVGEYADVLLIATSRPLIEHNRVLSSS